MPDTEVGNTEELGDASETDTDTEPIAGADAEEGDKASETEPDVVGGGDLTTDAARDNESAETAELPTDNNMEPPDYLSMFVFSRAVASRFGEGYEKEISSKGFIGFRLLELRALNQSASPAVMDQLEKGMKARVLEPTVCSGNISRRPKTIGPK